MCEPMYKSHTASYSPLFIRGPEVKLISLAEEQVRVLLPDPLANVILFMVTGSSEVRHGHFHGIVPLEVSEVFDILELDDSLFIDENAHKIIFD